MEGVLPATFLWGTIILCTFPSIEFEVFKNEINYVQALGKCRTIGENWQLPDLSDIHDGSGIPGFLHGQKIHTVWIGNRIHVYDHWQWLNGKNYTFDQSLNDTGNCGTITKYGWLKQAPCDEGNNNYICEFERPRTCPMGHICAFGKAPYLAVGCHAKDWYSARDYCERIKGWLVILDTDEKVDIASEALKIAICTGSKNKYYIGLSREDLITAESQTLNEWLRGDVVLKMCITASLNQKGDLELQRMHCLENAAAICIERIKRTYSTTEALHTTLKPTDTEVSPSGLVIGIGVGSGVVAVAIIIGVIILLKKRRANLRKKKKVPTATLR